MDSNCTYTQTQKNSVRHKSLAYAVEILTSERSNACCVKRNYVRKAYDYFISIDECNDKKEVEKIDISYINHWEKLHDSCIGYKRPEDLFVCYLCGPEPNNDFQELINLGILPQNIWAFENNLTTYKAALSSYDFAVFPQPKIIKQQIETFFQQTPKKFDIVYIDACGAIPSKQHALRCFSSLCKYHRLNSPGIVISNFAEPDTMNESIIEYQDLLSLYFLFKKNPNIQVALDDCGSHSRELCTLREQISKEFTYYYGEFISGILRDISSIIIPVQRFSNNSLIRQIIANQMFDTLKNVTPNFNDITNNSLSRYFLILFFLKNAGLIDEKTNCLLSELEGISPEGINIAHSFNLLCNLKFNPMALNEEVRDISNYFENGKNLYQFLDRTHSNMFLDLVINQMAYPLHYNSNAIRRYLYTAKSTKMFMDITVLDECRYIYEWLPAIHQIKSAFGNLSWQYIFRFALDGLVKNRYSYNNEFFFQGSVISNDIEGFTNKTIDKREVIY